MYLTDYPYLNISNSIHCIKFFRILSFFDCFAIPHPLHGWTQKHTPRSTKENLISLWALCGANIIDKGSGDWGLSLDSVSPYYTCNFSSLASFCHRTGCGLNDLQAPFNSGCAKKKWLGVRHSRIQTQHLWFSTIWIYRVIESLRSIKYLL